MSWNCEKRKGSEKQCKTQKKQKAEKRKDMRSEGEKALIRLRFLREAGLLRNPNCVFRGDLMRKPLKPNVHIYIHIHSHSVSH